MHERKVLPRGLGVLELATGILISGLGALALGLAADRLEPGPTQSAVMTMGGLGGALGLVLTSSGLYHLFAAETDRVLYAAP